MTLIALGLAADQADVLAHGRLLPSFHLFARQTAHPTTPPMNRPTA